MRKKNRIKTHFDFIILIYLTLFENECNILENVINKFYREFASNDTMCVPFFQTAIKYGLGMYT